METKTTITVYSDTDDYEYQVEAGPEILSVSYTEYKQTPVSISFGSIEEMESVAKAMLKLVKLHREP